MRDPREWGEEPAPGTEAVTDAAPAAVRAAPAPPAAVPPPAVPPPAVPPRAVPAPAVEPPSPDVEPVAAESSLPGAHRGGFTRLPTAPVEIAQPVVDREAHASIDTEPWLLPEPPRRGLVCSWALTFAIIGLVVSLFVGWGFLIGIVAIVAAIVALRRPLESRVVAVWALVLGAVSVIFSAGWLIYAAVVTDLLGPGPTLGLFTIG